MAIDKWKKLTPTENLILEVLTARYRLGENLWTFDSNVKRAVETLASKGWVIPMGGQVENTVRAALTEEAVGKLLSYDYMPPIVRDNEELAPAFRRIVEKAQSLQAEYDSAP